MIRRPLLQLVLIAWAALLPSASVAAAVLDAGRGVVVGGEEASVTPCFMCHGLDGVGDSAGAFPRLTGQAAFYLYKQLADYASEARPNDVMSPIAREMSERQMADVAYYYAVLDAAYAPVPDVAEELLERGRELAEDGLPEADVTACNLCHGADGAGNPPLFPYLAGQYAPYTALQLQLWQQDERRNDALDVMRDIAKALSAADIEAVALYYETLRPRAGPKVGARTQAPSDG